jgi:hypothetical protein
MVLFSIGLAQKKFGNYTRPMGAKQKSAATAFLKVLGTEQEQDALQVFLFTLFTQDKKNSSHHTLTVYRFLILYSFHQEGNLAVSGSITQYISGIVFLGRSTIFTKILEVMEKTKTGFFRYVI